jgi:hypothetical protein
MINNQIIRLIKPFVRNLNDIIAIKVDSIYFSKEVKYDETVFRNEQSLYIEVPTNIYPQIKE